MFCAACIHGVTAALVSPRQFTPIRNPSGSPGAAGFSSVGDESIVRKIRRERGQQPVGDALASRGFGEIGDAVLVAEQIVPERDPVLRVLVVVGEQPIHERGALAGIAIGEECLQFLRRRQQTPGVEIGAARELRVASRRLAPARRRALRYAATCRSSGADQRGQTARGVDRT